MTQDQINQVVHAALNCNIEVFIAKKQSDAKLSGVHLIEPTIADLINALRIAIDMGYSAVYIHSSIGYPYN